MFAIKKYNDRVIYTAELAASGGLRPGDDVLVAGIKVGEVTDVYISGPVVKADFTLLQDIQLGSQTLFDVRMLTPLGGRFVRIVPGGAESNSTLIPIDRTNIPFEIGQLIRLATSKIDGLDARSTRSTLSELLPALTKHSEQITRIFDSISSLSGMLDANQKDLKRGILLSEEYTRATAAERDEIELGIAQNSLISQKLAARKVEIVKAVSDFHTVINFLRRVTVAVTPQLDRYISDVERIISSLTDVVRDVENGIDNLSGLIQSIQGKLSESSLLSNEVLGKENSVEFCIPSLIGGCSGE
ncbi:MAG: MlaD family protein [Mycobacteriaceae bacterium]